MEQKRGSFGNRTQIATPIPTALILGSNEYQSLLYKNEMLTGEVSELKYRYENLKKEQQIWEQIQNNSAAKSEPKQWQDKEQHYQQEINSLNSELLDYINVRKQLQKQNEELHQKVNDFKYHNQELKSLNQKLTLLHKKEVEMLQKDSSNGSNEAGLRQSNQELRREKQLLQHKLEQCKEIVKEMEEFYAAEIASLKAQTQILSTQKSQVSKQTELIKDQFRQATTDFEKVISEIERKQSRQRQDEEFSTLIASQAKDKKWELIVQEMQQTHQREVFHLKDKIKFLIVKLESLQSESNFRPEESICYPKDFLVQSKGDLFRYSPSSVLNTSFSSSIKESLTKLDVKTPNKYTRVETKQAGLYDRTNF